MCPPHYPPAHLLCLYNKNPVEPSYHPHNFPGVGQFLNCAFGITFGIETECSQTVSCVLHQCQWLFTMNLVLCIVINVWHTSALCFYLSKREPHPSFKHRILMLHFQDTHN
jgi:hypothetical protein